MKNSFKLKALCAALAMSAASAASASQIFLDVGANFQNGATGAVCPTCTSVKDNLTYKYESTTVITDLNANNIIDAGDLVDTKFGMQAFTQAELTKNQVTSLNPSQVFGSPSDNGYYNNWFLTFGANNLMGQITGISGSGATSVPLFAYGAGGIINLYLTFNGTTYNNFMDLYVLGGGATGVSTELFGTPSFSAVQAGYNNLIHAANGVNCSGNTGFADLMACSPAPVIGFNASQNTSVYLSAFLPAGKDASGRATWSLTSQHNGVLSFNVPEPSMLLLMGGALLGLGLSSRRRAKQD